MNVESMVLPQVGGEPESVPPSLTRYAWLSIVVAIATIGLKSAAYLITGSVGLLSDAAESVVNLVTAVDRLLHPAAIESAALGLAVSTVASLLNGLAATVLLRAGRRHRSITLVADGKHLMTDVWTSVGVLVGVLLVAVTGWRRLDALVAAAVGLNILVTGFRLVAQSAVALLDVALSPEDDELLQAALAPFRGGDVDIADVRTRQSGQHRFVSLTLLVPGDWTVRRGHDLADAVEAAIGSRLPGVAVQTHLEPHPAPGPGAEVADDAAGEVVSATGPARSSRTSPRSA